MASFPCFCESVLMLQQQLRFDGFSCKNKGYTDFLLLALNTWDDKFSDTLPAMPVQSEKLVFGGEVSFLLPLYL